MKEKNNLKGFAYLVIALLAVFLIVSFFERNYEYMFYTAVMAVLFLLIFRYYRELNLSSGVMFGLVLLIIMHALGCTFYVYGTRLYDLWIIPHFLRYDNIVHLEGVFVATLFAYDFLYPHLSREFKSNKILLCLLLVLTATGIGALNEISEFTAVVFFKAGQAVGDYLNNALDLVFNLIGAVFACFYIIFFRIKR